LKLDTLKKILRPFKKEKEQKEYLDKLG
jgi:hypothetical protein